MPDRNDPRYRLAGFLLLSAILHVLVLAVSTTATSGGAPAGRQRPPLLARLVMPTEPVPAHVPADVPAAGDDTTAAPTTLSPAGEPETPAGEGAVAIGETSGGPIPVDSEPFLPSSHLTRQPETLSNPPQEALLRIMELSPRGMAILTLWIDRHGQVSHLEIDRTNLPPEAAAIAREAFSGLRFAPGQRNGKPVNSVIRMEVKVY